MEDPLTVYKQDLSPGDRPLVCMDETSKQLSKETRRPIRARSGRQTSYDYEYERDGVCILFMFFEPLGGRRHVSVTDRRTKLD